MITQPRVVLIAMLSLSLTIAACDAPAPEEVATDAIVPVTTATVALGTVRAHLLVTGVVSAAPGADLIVVAPQAARIAELTKAEGDPVHRGDLLVRYDIPTLSADAAKQRAEVGRAQARLANARAAQTRAHDLFDRGIAARKEAEDADREVADAHADVEGAQAAATSADALAGQRVVRATFDGVVARRQHNPGDHVEASASDAILRVVDPARLEVLASVPMADVRRVTRGATARLRGGPPSAVLHVVSQPIAIDPATASVPVRLAIGAPLDLPVGAPVSIEIDAEEHRGVVVVPKSAVVHEGDETAVFVAVDGKAARRPVTLGLSDGVQVELTSGLRPGEQVIVAGHETLPDGAGISAKSPSSGPST
jgi:cobalt-zinc-cadmium efflux system membrane fusion protein